MSLKNVSFCATCHKSNSSDLKLCTKCRVVRYCSRQCQRRDFNSHKAICAKIDTLAFNRTSFQVNTLVAAKGQLTLVPKDEHLTDLTISESLCDEVWKLADKHESYEMTEIYLRYLNQMVHFDQFVLSSALNTHTKIPFAFIILGRDDDAFNFIQNWLFNHPRLHDQCITIEEGRWRQYEDECWLHTLTYDKTEDIQDTLGACVNFFNDAPIAFVAAILLIKLKLVLEYEDNASKLGKFMEKISQADAQSLSGSLKSCPDVMKSIELFAIGEPKKHEQSLTSQKAQLKTLVDVLRKRAPDVLPTLLSKQSWEKETHPCMNVQAETEKSVIMRHTSKFLKRLQGARQKLMDL